MAEEEKAGEQAAADPSIEVTESLLGTKPDDEGYTDPGSHEGKTKTVKKSEPEPGSPRWTEVYGKWKGGERELETLKEKLVEKDKDIEAMRGEFKQVFEAVNKIPVPKDEPKPDPIDAEIVTVSASITSKREALKDAREAINPELETKLEDELDELKDQRAVLKAKKAVAPLKKEEPPKGKAPDLSRDVTDFIKATPWFDGTNNEHDPEMYLAAIGLEQKLGKDKEWLKKPEKERLADIKTRIEKRFDWKGTNGNGKESAPPARASNMVDSGGDGMGAGSMLPKNQLSDAEKRTAVNLFPSMDPADAYKKYATGKQTTAGRR